MVIISTNLQAPQYWQKYMAVRINKTKKVSLPKRYISICKYILAKNMLKKTLVIKVSKNFLIKANNKKKIGIMTK